MGFTTTVREHEHIAVNEDGTRTLNLDELFKGALDSYPESEIDGFPTQTIKTKFRAGVKLMDQSGNYLVIGGWDENHYHRQEYMGELVRGPQMFAVPMGAMISAHPDPLKETAYLIEEGDTVIFLGAKFVASAKNWEKRLKFERI